MHEINNSDEHLMLRVASGDRDAFRQLLDRHLARIVAFAARVLADRSGADDIAQETFLRLWTHAATWEPKARLTTWLHRVALNLCFDSMAQRRGVGLDDIEEPRDQRPSVLDALHERDVGRHVGAALAALPPQQRAAITLCHYQGLRNIEAAEILEISVEALESLLARGRRGLKEMLRPIRSELLPEG